MPIKTMKFITRDFVKSHPDWIFVFGDNDQRQGHGGQAASMRGEKNTVGIRTKTGPWRSPNAYYSDDNLDDNIFKIEFDICAYIFPNLIEGKTVVFPQDGIGTGMAELDKRAPLTYKYLQDTLKELFDEYGPVEEIA